MQLFLATFSMQCEASVSQSYHGLTELVRSFGDGPVNDFIDGEVICQTIFINLVKENIAAVLDLNGGIPPGMSIRA
jgi:hypothetical protein